MFRRGVIALIYRHALDFSDGCFEESVAVTLMSTDVDRIILSLVEQKTSVGRVLLRMRLESHSWLTSLDGRVWCLSWCCSVRCYLLADASTPSPLIQTYTLTRPSVVSWALADFQDHWWPAESEG